METHKCRIELRSKLCYVCGSYVFPNVKRNITKTVKTAYSSCFKLLVIENVLWAPNSICQTCYFNLLQIHRGERETMPFHRPMIWKCPANETDCFFCRFDKIAGCNKFCLDKIIYPEVSSVEKPVLYNPKSQNIPSGKSELLVFSQERNYCIVYFLKETRNSYAGKIFVRLCFIIFT